ncbi:hypothetical protein [Sodalis sp.]|uniref:hypothetical protein n=1 Tax=Sodalis sp. (in: enterobacteria) TaxID=1898979 RepID=UPI00387386AB
MRFLFATTENSENILPTTFYRRIQVITLVLITPFGEKLALVSTFSKLKRSDSPFDYFP